MFFKVRVKPFSFQLSQNLKTAKGILQKKKGWLIHLENSAGDFGWG